MYEFDSSGKLECVDANAPQFLELATGILKG